MRADILLEVMDHPFSMVKVLDGKENGHCERKQGGQPNDDLKTETFIKLYLFHRIFDINNLVLKFWPYALGIRAEKMTVLEESPFMPKCQVQAFHNTHTFLPSDSSLQP